MRDGLLSHAIRDINMVDPPARANKKRFWVSILLFPGDANHHGRLCPVILKTAAAVRCSELRHRCMHRLHESSVHINRMAGRCATNLFHPFQPHPAHTMSAFSPVSGIGMLHPCGSRGGHEAGRHWTKRLWLGNSPKTDFKPLWALLVMLRWTAPERLNTLLVDPLFDPIRKILVLRHFQSR